MDFITISALIFLGAALVFLGQALRPWAQNIMAKINLQQQKPLKRGELLQDLGFSLLAFFGAMQAFTGQLEQEQVLMIYTLVLLGICVSYTVRAVMNIRFLVAQAEKEGAQ